MSDLPPELTDFPTRRGLSNILQGVFEGADVVAIHPDKALVAAWYGGTGFNVYDPAQWVGRDPVNDDGSTGEVYHFNTTDPSRLDDPEANARETLEGYGFEVVG